MGRRIFLAILAVFTSVATAQAQAGGRITGTVASADGNRPIPNVQVGVTGIARGALTDTAGRYMIVDVPPGTYTVVTRALGWAQGSTTVTVTAGAPATANFTLASAPTTLNPLVVVGYGEQDRRTLTGSVATVGAEKLKDIPTENPMKALQGRVAGVEIVAANNEPGAAMNVRIRGVRSLTASNEPLFVVDGIPITGGIQDFNPQLIESIEVLKDASATAVYGSRGANGVILVTTKKGVRDGRLHTTYSADAYYGIQEPVQLIPMMNLQQYVRYMKDAAAAIGQDTSIARIFSA